MKKDTSKLVMTGLLIALSAVGALIKIPGTTIALDSLPAFFTAAFFGPMFGGIVGVLGHLFTALTSGFPLTIPLHLIISALMFIACYAYGWVRIKINVIVAIIVGILINGPVALFVSAQVASLMGMEFSGMIMFTVLLLPLTAGSAVNILLSEAVYGILKLSKQGIERKVHE